MLLKKIIIYSIVPVLVITIFECRLNMHVNNHYKMQYDEIFHPKVNADIIIIGTSYGNHGINPRDLESENSKIYNFAFDGANPAFFLKWYNVIFKKYYKKPRLIIFETPWYVFSGNYLWRTIEFDSGYFPMSVFIRVLLNPTCSAEKTLFNRFIFMKEGRKFEYLNKDKPYDIAFDITKYYHGYTPVKGTISKSAKSEMIGKISSKQVADFEKLLDQFKLDKIQVVLVCLPECFPARTAVGFEEGNKLIEKIAKRQGILLLNYNYDKVSKINYDYEFFSDFGHLNEKGSLVVSRLLKNDLAKNNINF